MCDKNCSLTHGQLMPAPGGMLEVFSPTHYQRVAGLNIIFGNPAGDPLNLDWDALQLQLELIQEEMAELSEAHTARDIQAIRDALADVRVTTYGYNHLMGVCADDDMLRVHESNMSKICRTRQELEATIKHYETLGVKVFEGGKAGAWWVKSSEDQYDCNGKFYPAGKFQKSVNFHEPRFMPLVRQLDEGELIREGDLVQVDGKPDQYIEYQGVYGVPVTEFRRAFFRRVAVAQTHPVQGATVVAQAGIPAELACEGDCCG